MLVNVCINFHPLPGTGESVFPFLGNICQLASFGFFFQTGNQSINFDILFLA
jgi:hypothetical protein